MYTVRATLPAAGGQLGRRALSGAGVVEDDVAVAQIAEEPLGECCQLGPGQVTRAGGVRSRSTALR